MPVKMVSAEEMLGGKFVIRFGPGFPAKSPPGAKPAAPAAPAPKAPPGGR